MFDLINNTTVAEMIGTPVWDTIIAAIKSIPGVPLLITLIKGPEMAMYKLLMAKISDDAIKALRTKQGILVEVTMSQDNAIDIKRSSFVPAQDVEDFASGKRVPK